MATSQSISVIKVSGEMHSNAFKRMLGLLGFSFTVGLSDSTKIAITIDSCKLFMMHDTVTIVKNYATSL